MKDMDLDFGLTFSLKGKEESFNYKNLDSLILFSDPSSFSYGDLTSALSITSMVAQVVKNLPAVQVTQVQSLGQEDPLEKGMATHSSILAWRIPKTEEPGRLQSMGLQRVRHNWAPNNFTLPIREVSCVGGVFSFWRSYFKQK